MPNKKFSHLNIHSEYSIIDSIVKIDRLSEALVSMARIEERVTTVLKQTDRFMDRLDKMEERLEIVELQSNLNKKSVTSTERVIWILVTAGISTAFYMLR